MTPERIALILKRRGELSRAGTPIYLSDDNGQMACKDHRDLYGRIPWHRMSGAEQVSMRAELSDVLAPADSLCEICRGNARRAAAANSGAGR
jgi:hypothetical protein